MGSPSESVQEKLYKTRWIVLIVQCMLNITNNMNYIGYASVTNFVNEYYDRSNVTNIMSIVFLGVSVPTFIIALVIAEKVGVRWMMLGSAFLNATGAGIRILSTVDSFDSDTRYALVIFGQAISASANPATLLMNTKIPSLWFPSNQRSLATALATTCGPLGILIVSPLSSAIVNDTSDLFKLNIIVFTPAAVNALFGVIFIHRSAPPTPPSKSSNIAPLTTLEGVKKLARNKDYLILLLGMGSGLGYFNMYYTGMEQMLCSRGYDNSFSALCIVLMLAGGIVGAVIAGAIVDRTKRYDEIYKVSVCVANFFGIVFCESSLHQDASPWILLGLIVFGTFGIAYYAVGNDISAEITYPVPETLSAGCIGLAGQLSGVIYVSVFNALSTPLPDAYANIQKCTLSGQTADQEALVEHDTVVPLFTIGIVATVIAMASVLFFKPKYLRVNLEKSKEQNPNANEKNKPLEITVVVQTKVEKY